MKRWWKENIQPDSPLETVGYVMKTKKVVSLAWVSREYDLLDLFLSRDLDGSLWHRFCGMSLWFRFPRGLDLSTSASDAFFFCLISTLSQVSRHQRYTTRERRLPSSLLHLTPFRRSFAHFLSCGVLHLGHVCILRVHRELFFCCPSNGIFPFKFPLPALRYRLNKPVWFQGHLVSDPVDFGLYDGKLERDRARFVGSDRLFIYYVWQDIVVGRLQRRMERLVEGA